MILVSSVNVGLPAGKVSRKGEAVGMQPCDCWVGGSQLYIPAFDLCGARPGAVLVVVT